MMYNFEAYLYTLTFKHAWVFCIVGHFEKPILFIFTIPLLNVGNVCVQQQQQQQQHEKERSHLGSGLPFGLFQNVCLK